MPKSILSITTALESMQPCMYIEIKSINAYTGMIVHAVVNAVIENKTNK